MRYQRRLKREMRELYQSNDPLHWVYLSLKMGNKSRVMTDRERQIFMRRLTKTFKSVADFIKKTFEQLPKIVSNVAESIAKMTAAFNNNPNMNTPLVKTNISIGVADNTDMSGVIARNRIMGELMVKPIAMPHMALGTIHTDEAMNLDDETIETVNKAVQKGKNGGKPQNNAIDN